MMAHDHITPMPATPGSPEASRLARAKAERYVLGAMLLWPERWPEASPRLDEGCFEWEAHRHLYKAMALVADFGGVPDPASVISQLLLMPYGGEVPDGSWTSYTSSLAHQGQTVDGLDLHLRRVGRPPAEVQVLDEDWPDPLPFGAVEVPEIPASILPQPLAGFVLGLAEALQVPETAVAMVCLSVVAASMAKRAVVMGGPDWQEPLNLYTATVMPPGERKSALMRYATRPLVEWERASAITTAPKHAAAMAEKRILEQRARGLEKKASASRDPSIRDEAIRAAQEAAAYIMPHVPRQLVDDITPEALVGAMQGNGGRTAMMSEEGGVFDIMAGLYSNGTPKLDPYLKGHSGDPIRVDRIGRPSEFVEDPALTLGLAIQPDVIQALGENKRFRGRGLISRFIFAMPASMVGRRRIECEPLSAATETAYSRALMFLLDLPMGQDLQGGRRPFRLHLGMEARVLFVEFRTKTEPRLGPDGDLSGIADWGSKFPGAVLRIAGLMHSIEMADRRMEPWSASIDGPTMARAIEMGELLIHHAQAAYGQVGISQEQASAVRLLDWIRRTQPDRFTQREAYRALSRHFSRTADLDAPLQLLSDRGYLREVGTLTKVGKVTRIVPGYKSHPSLVSEKSRNVSMCQRSVNASVDANGAHGQPIRDETSTMRRDPYSIPGARTQKGPIEIVDTSSLTTPQPLYSCGLLASAKSVDTTLTSVDSVDVSKMGRQEEPPFDPDLDAYGWAEFNQGD